MTTKVTITNSSPNTSLTSHNIGVYNLNNPSSNDILSPGETKDFYVWGTENLIIKEMP